MDYFLLILLLQVIVSNNVHKVITNLSTSLKTYGNVFHLGPKLLFGINFLNI